MDVSNAQIIKCGEISVHRSACKEHPISLTIISEDGHNH